ncbi:MAG: AMP-binding protein, partial [Actinomycetota bacterium]
MADAYAQFRSARDLLLSARTDYSRAVADYVAPRPADFNWGLDWFDRIAADSTTGARAALKLVEADGTSHSVTYAEMSARSSQVASWLSSLGAVKGDRLLLMMGNQVELWETLLACIKLGVVVIPATTLLTPDDLDDRITRGSVRHVVTASVDAPKFADVPGSYTRIAAGEPVAGWTVYSESLSAPTQPAATGFTPPESAGGDDTLLLYFTSGTTAQPKLVEH